MAKKTKNEIFNIANTDKTPAFVSFKEGTPEERANAIIAYQKALEVGLSKANYDRRDFSGLTSNIDGRPGLRSGDFDWFRPDQAAPIKPKDIIAFSRFVYRRIGLVHNAIDLMGDFTAQGIRLAHPNPRIEKFHNEWFEEVGGKHITERMANLLFREANVFLRFYTAKILKKKREEMQRSIAVDNPADISIDMKNRYFSALEIPWKYVFIDPLLLEPIGGEVGIFSQKQAYKLILPTKLRSDIATLRNTNSPEAKKILSELPPDILKAVESNQEIILPIDKTRSFFYKKDDWQVWADSMIYAAFEPLTIYQKLQLTDKAALDGATSKIRVWKLGNMKEGIVPTPAASAMLADILSANVGGGVIDLVWGDDIDLIETSTDIQAYLGEAKYKPTLEAIYATLGIPPTLTGTSGASGTTNNLMSLKTLTERLNYVRNIICVFWKEQLNIVQKAMGFRFPAEIEFDYMQLDDPAAMLTLLTNLVDRNILSEEFIQRYVKAKPSIEDRRKKTEKTKRKTQKMDKVSPYHPADKEHELNKIALQTGIISPSEVGIELEEKKAGEKSGMEWKDKQLKQQKKNAGTGLAPTKKKASTGRPKNSRDVVKRKTKTFKPKTKASDGIWD